MIYIKHQQQQQQKQQINEQTTKHDYIKYQINK